MASLAMAQREGRLLTRTRIGSDNSEIVQETNVYNLAGRRISSTDALNHTTTYAESADVAGRLQRTTTHPDTGTRIETYHFDNRLFTVSGSAARPAKYLYGVDSGEGYYEQRILIGNGGAETEWTRDYRDLANRIVKTEDASGAEALLVYNNLDQLSKKVDADGVTTLYTYDSLGRTHAVALDLNRDGAIGAGDPVTLSTQQVLNTGNGVVRRSETRIVTDNDTEVLAYRTDQSPNGRLAWIQRWGLTATQTTTLGPDTQKTETVIYPDGSEELRHYQQGRLSSVTLAAANDGPVVYSRSVAYDAHGRQITVTDTRNGATTYAYDSLDRIVAVTAPVPDAGQPAQVTQHQYDAMGRQLKTIWPDGSETTYQYTLAGDLQQQNGSQTPTLQYSYDPQGRLKTLTTTGQAGPAITTWNHDAQTGRLTSKVDAGNQAVSYAYSGAGRLLSRTWARGVQTDYVYDDGGRLVEIDYSDATPDVTFALNRLGQITSISDAAGTRTQTFSPDGRLLTELHTGGLFNGVSATHSYDSLLRRSSHQVSVGAATHQASYTYDGASRLQTVVSGADVAAYGYLVHSSLIGTVVQMHQGNAGLTTTKTYGSNGSAPSAPPPALGWSPPTPTATTFSTSALKQRWRTAAAGSINMTAKGS